MQAAASCPSASKASSEYGSTWRSGRWSLAVSPAVVSVISLVVVTLTLAQAPIAPGRPGHEHLQKILERFRANGLEQATVVLDSQGRVELQGTYENEREVDRAFSLAQTVVEFQWVSPVTPERIRVTKLKTCLERLFEGIPCDDKTRPPPREPPSGPVQKKFALVIGVGRFGDLRVPQLTYAAIDAADVYQYLVNPSGGNFRPEAVKLLQDAKATRANVAAALEQIKANAGPDDLIFVYLSSHGTPPDKSGGVFIITYDTVLEPREEAWRTSVNEDLLRPFIQGVQAKRLIIILDTCYSNAAYAQVPQFLPPGADENKGSGLPQQYMAERLLGMKGFTSEPVVTPKSPGIAPEGWGKVLISSSGANERSWESSTLQNGVFTHYFLRGLMHTKGNVRAAFAYASPLVHQQVKKERGANIDQTPQITANPPGVEISLTTGG